MKQSVVFWRPACPSACFVTSQAVPAIRSDAALVEACLNGSQDSWSELIRRYKQLVYSVIRKYDVAPEDARDIFQAVCLELFTGLPRLREANAIPKWIITVTSRQCLRWKQLHLRNTAMQSSLMVDVEAEIDIDRLEQQQIVRRALDQVSRRCQEMIRLLFFQRPPVPYMQLAPRLGLAVGSIGFIRGRCLKRLRAELERLGF